MDNQMKIDKKRINEIQEWLSDLRGFSTRLCLIPEKRKHALKNIGLIEDIEAIIKEYQDETICSNK